MSEETEMDVEALRDELDHIKDAMGIRERYPSKLKGWLAFGLLVPLASLASQLIVLRELPGYWHAVVWFVTMGAGGLYLGRGGPGRGNAPERPDTGTKPSLPLVGGAVFALYFVFLATVGPALAGASAARESIIIFSFVVGLVGVVYVTAGNVLKAYYIRKRDRYAFYVGGAWMLVLAAAMPNVPALETWGYAVFGGLYAAHAVGVYALLSE